MELRQRAKIIRAVEIIYGDIEQVATSPQAEPVMQLADGREATAYHCDRFTPEGTEGWAEYQIEKNIWTFTPDVYEAEPLKPGDLPQ